MGAAFVLEKRASLAQIVERHLDCDFSADDDGDFVADHLPRQRRAYDVALIMAVTVPFIVTLGTLTIESALRLTAPASNGLRFDRDQSTCGPSSQV